MKTSVFNEHTIRFCVWYLCNQWFTHLVGGLSLSLDFDLSLRLDDRSLDRSRRLDSSRRKSLSLELSMLTMSLSL